MMIEKNIYRLKYLALEEVDGSFEDVATSLNDIQSKKFVSTNTVCNCTITQQAYTEESLKPNIYHTRVQKTHK